MAAGNSNDDILAEEGLLVKVWKSATSHLTLFSILIVSLQILLTGPTIDNIEVAFVLSGN